MTGFEIPAGLQAFIDSTNAGDSEAFVAAFTADATLDDWGRKLHGSEGVASWNRTDNIGVQSHFELVSAEPGPDAGSIVAVLKVTGNGYNGTGPMTFEFDGELISRLTIAPTG